ncbi:MAG: flagellar basal body L-ring protein FlgH [Acidobacteria bacterium]|nr:flagellar basal body L-ring protein FlgH [Acidobacteriota bacterium]
MKYAAKVISLLMIPALFSAACGPTQARVQDPTELRSYVESAHRKQQERENHEGSLWNGSSYRSNLFRDSKARYVDDVVTIRVMEATQAVATADAKNAKNTSASAGFDNLFGAEKLVKEIPTMLSGKGGSSFEGEGSTSRATTLETTLTARVLDVLPNGYLVVEGMREIRVNNENQSVYLMGVVRPDDIASNNVVLSSSIAQMSVRLQGKGMVSQPIKPGWLYKILNGILPF